MQLMTALPGFAECGVSFWDVAVFVRSGTQVTFKTILIGIALVAGFVGFISVAWDISAWFLGTPDVVVKQAPVTTPPVEKIEANTAGQNGKAATEPVQASKDDHDQPVQSGAYDDSWTGSEQPKADAALAPVQQVQPKSVPAEIGSRTAADPYAPDDREAPEEPKDAGSSLPSAQNDDPYKGDDREN